ncbi:GyrI-like domain-containing protein [Kribbella sandramycini]|uniref:Effector-binding domain-containing protein n=1 Tax=Kribbella sandramycini TaxID=60450 RepID=A0A7Y4L484_9ACTN|nr:GyrI-like domain-containing protein [Kribbella sandramycini]MBB6570908.1 effector-binding domain-containing protein [Kribbella sandramycini]NOL44039.1 GyrI-like domain-containing protein [Kribbella sandramycini]
MPEIIEVAERPYVALRGTVRMDEISAFADRMHEVIGWLAAREIAPNDAPFFRYEVVDMAAGLVLEIGFPVDDVHSGEGEIVTGVLPAGRYASVEHHGHPDGLMAATRDLLAWGEQEGIEWDAEGDKWVSRLEIYKSDPREVPSMADWDTELQFKLKD